MSHRLYVSTANSYAILKGAVLQGLGHDGDIIHQWPKGRSYHDIAWFRSPYRSGYYQDGSLLGLGALPGNIAAGIDAAAPPEVKRYLLSGEPVPKLSNNVSLPLNQIPRIGYGLIAVGAAALCYISYKRHRKARAASGG